MTCGRIADMSDHAALSTKRIAILVEEDFEDRELPLLLELLRETPLQITVVGPIAGTTYKGKRQEATVTADLAAGKARAKDFDMVVVPGGYAPDRIRMRHAMVDLIRDTYDAGKPLVTIDRGAQLLITINAVRGRTITCWPSIAIDIKNAGGRYVDRPFVEDGHVITARKWDDVVALSDVIVRVLGGDAA